MHKRLLYDLERMQNMLDKAKRNRTKEKLLSEARLSSLPRKRKSTTKETSEDAISQEQLPFANPRTIAGEKTLRAAEELQKESSSAALKSWRVS